MKDWIREHKKTTILVVVIFLQIISGGPNAKSPFEITVYWIAEVLFIYLLWLLFGRFFRRRGPQDDARDSFRTQPVNEEFGQRTTYRNRWYRFKRGFYYDKKGYPRWRNTNRLVHRTIAAKKFGGKIPPGLVVHHRDENRGNFRDGNLVTMTRSEHARLHTRERMRKWWHWF